MERSLFLLEERGASATNEFSDVLGCIATLQLDLGNEQLALDFIRRAVAAYASGFFNKYSDDFLQQTLKTQFFIETQLGLNAEAAATQARRTALLRRSQTHCAVPDCQRRVKADGASLERCAACLSTFYCSVACQTADWKAGHKAECATLVAEGKTSGGARSGGS